MSERQIPHQEIVFGAPGTGKSWLLEERMKSQALPSCSRNLRQCFLSWLPHNGVVSSAERYVKSLASISESISGGHNQTEWPGCFELLVGHKPDKKIFEAASFAEFLRIYRDFEPFLTDDEARQGACAQTISDEFYNWRRIRGAGSGAGFMLAAFNKYKAFLRWLDAQTECSDAIRTTFHPDSDYSTFVGCYKPTMEKKPRYGQQGLPIKVNGVELTEDVISYSYVPQAFTKAYVRAWSKLFDSGKNDEEKRQYLVIEEINRGNCAQIFGDLFQLLDRKGDWYSKYPIDADTDLARYVGEELGKLSPDVKANIPAEVLSGAKLILPPNLYIWATMNTSDQSLFPMDSAFKRRWEWEYIPIKNAGEDNPGLVWKIVAGGEEFPWWDFLKTINKCILDALKNEDKQLGYFFARPDDDTSDVIPASKFVNKVLFYLYNDVFKDYELPKGFAKPGGGKFAFADFFIAGGKTDEVKVKELLSNLLPKSQQAGDANE